MFNIIYETIVFYYVWYKVIKNLNYKCLQYDWIWNLNPKIEFK